MPGNDLARWIEGARRLLEVATVLVLVASEASALNALGSEGDCDPVLVYGGLAWGFTVIAALAVVGAGRARVSIAFGVSSADPLTIEIGYSNEFGDHNLEPMRNVLFGDGAQIYRSKADGSNSSPAALPLTTAGYVEGELWHVRYSHDHPRLTAGDALVSDYRLTFGSGVERIPVIARLDHVELPGGRVEEAVWVHRDGDCPI